MLSAVVKENAEHFLCEKMVRGIRGPKERLLREVLMEEVVFE